MKPSKRIQPVAEIAQQKADDAARDVAAWQRKLQDIQIQLDELVAYRDDYASGLQHKGRMGFSAIRMQDYRQFLSRLNQAIEQQQGLQEGARTELAASRQLWRIRQQRARALDAVVTRHEQVQHRKQLRRDQHENDEHAARIMRREVS